MNLRFYLLPRLITCIMFFVGMNTSISQVGFIGPMTADQGGGVPLFGHDAPIGGDMFINWEVFVNGAACGGTGTTGGGQGSDCRVLVRGMSASTDPTSLVASDVECIVNGIYNGENGNNDVYFVNLNVCNLPSGRYSVEVQCDCLGGDYDNSTGGSTAAASWIYNTPSPYYTGTSGACGPADPLDNINEIVGGGPAFGSPQLEYFNVGDADIYRSMVVLNGLFMDMGKFQQGNPTLPSNLNDLQTLYDPACVSINSFPTMGFCDADMLMLDGAEVNVTKRTDCGNADVTGNRLCYRVYEQGTAAPAYTCINIGFLDNCPNGYPSTTVFPTGGSCQNLNDILDQRWQTTSAGVDILALAPSAGIYDLEFYTETDIVDCGGVASTVTEPSNAPTGIYVTSFEKLETFAASCASCPSLPQLTSDVIEVCKTSESVNFTIDVADLFNTENMIQNFGVELVYFTAPTTDPYTGGTSLATIAAPTMAGVTQLTTTGNLPATNGLYYIYAILDPAPSGVYAACRPNSRVVVKVKMPNCGTFPVNPN